MGQTNSRTERTGMPITGDTIYRTTISNGNRTVTGDAYNSRDSQQVASDKWSNSGSSESSGGSSSGGSSGGCSSGGGCYVTTACLDALGLPRDSLELRAMKTLTKEHILKSFSGKRDYVAYQRKGPKIVDAISSRDDKESIWKGIYGQLRNVTSSILSGDYNKGHSQYKDLILGLEKQFVTA